jgi:hypothetical protein
VHEASGKEQRYELCRRICLDEEIGEGFQCANENKVRSFYESLPKREVGERTIDVIGYLANL